MTPLFKMPGKKLPEDLGEHLKPEVTKGRKVRLMFQDEARFGRMVKIRRCWAPAQLSRWSTTATSGSLLTSMEP